MREVSMAVKLSCPRCATTVDVDLADGEITIGYDIGDWKRRCDCEHADAPTTCQAAVPVLWQHLVADVAEVGAN
jgi:hypothetical protein